MNRNSGPSVFRILRSTLLAVCILSTPGVALSGPGVDTLPTAKRAAMTAAKIRKPADKDIDRSTDDKLREPAPDVGSLGEIVLIKEAVNTLQLKFNKAQVMPADPQARRKHATDVVNDVKAAAARGKDPFVDEIAPHEMLAQEVTGKKGFRSAMVHVFDRDTVADMALPIAQQLKSDAEHDDIPSLVETSFVVDEWQGVTIDRNGRKANVVLTGTYTNCFSGGSFKSVQCHTDGPSQWRIEMRKGKDDLWRMASRNGARVEGNARAEGPAASILKWLGRATSKVSISKLLGIQDAFAYPSYFNKYGARDYALKWVDGFNPAFPNYDPKGGDCTNFVSQAWNVGGEVPQSSVWYNKSGAFIRVREFREYWFNNDYQYIYVQGDANLRANYSPADYGDVYIYDTGDSSEVDWYHAAIEVGWDKGYDEVAYHSNNRKNQWNVFYLNRTPSQKANITRPGRGFRIIRAGPYAEQQLSPAPNPTPTPTPSCAGPNGHPSTPTWINIWTTAIGRTGTDNACPQVGQSYTTSNPQYVWCRRLGGEVSDGVNSNHWWLWTDLDTGGSAWISAYYLQGQGNNEANGIPDCW